MTTHNEHREELVELLEDAVYDIDPNDGDNLLARNPLVAADAILKAGWRKQGAAHPDGWRVKLLAALDSEEGSIKRSRAANGSQADLDQVAGRLAELERVRTIIGSLAGQGAADDDTTRLRAELAETQREAEGWKELADRWERDHQNTVLPYTTKVEAERDDLQARIDKALRLCTVYGYESGKGHKAVAAGSLAEEFRATLTQVSQPQPPRPDGRPQGDPTPCDCGQAPQHHHHIEGGPAIEVSRPQEGPQQ